MRLHVYVKGKLVAHLYRQADEYALRYTGDATTDDFVSLTMPVRKDAWVWPRDLHPFFRQNLPEGFLLPVCPAWRPERRASVRSHAGAADDGRLPLDAHADSRRRRSSSKMEAVHATSPSP